MAPVKKLSKSQVGPMYNAEPITMIFALVNRGTIRKGSIFYYEEGDNLIYSTEFRFNEDTMS